MKKFIRKIVFKFFRLLIPELNILKEDARWSLLMGKNSNSQISKKAKIYLPYSLINSKIDAFSYISSNSKIVNTTIGKFCAIGPNFMSGHGLHPTDGLSISPMFYSASNKSNGVTLCKETKFEEHRPILIGNDVFIGANVVVLDGIKIGDGAVIGAGAVVSKDIPDFAVAVGVPIKIIKYRFSEEQREILKKIKWWYWDEDKLQEIEKYFYDIDLFIKNHDLSRS